MLDEVYLLYNKHLPVSEITWKRYNYDCCDVAYVFHHFIMGET